MKKIDGLQVGNSLSTLRLKVTKRDIAKGAPLNANACAVVVAALRQVEGCTAAKTHMSVAYLMINGKWRRYRIPAYLKQELIAFDRGGRFVPDVYDLLPISTVQIARPKTRNTVGRRTGKRRKPHHLKDVRDSAYGNDL